MDTSKNSSAKKPYKTPAVSKVKLEDKRTVSMAVCKDSLETQGCGVDGVTPLSQISPS